jgi:hypothetical protein
VLAVFAGGATAIFLTVGLGAGAALTTGCESANRIPATKLPSVRCAAKPTMIVSIAEDASSPPATARTCGITSSADSTPTVTTAASTPRRKTR